MGPSWLPYRVPAQIVSVEESEVWASTLSRVDACVKHHLPWGSWPSSFTLGGGPAQAPRRSGKMLEGVCACEVVLESVPKRDETL